MGCAKGVSSPLHQQVTGMKKDDVNEQYNVEYFTGFIFLSLLNGSIRFSLRNTMLMD